MPMSFNIIIPSGVDQVVGTYGANVAHLDQMLDSLGA